LRYGQESIFESWQLAVGSWQLAVGSWQLKMLLNFETCVKRRLIYFKEGGDWRKVAGRII
jgi:hypothetical protein